MKHQFLYNYVIVKSGSLNGNIVAMGMNVQNFYCFGPSVSGIIDLNVGDYVQLSVCHDSGSTMRIAQWPQVSFQGFFLGL